MRVKARPEEAPADAVAAVAPLSGRIRALGGIWHALLLIAIVLGAIYSGLATPNEAAAFGAAGVEVIEPDGDDVTMLDSAAEGVVEAWKQEAGEDVGTRALDLALGKS